MEAGSEAYLLHDRISVRGGERLLQVLTLRHLALRYVCEDIRDLKDVIDVCLDPVSPLLHLVLVAGNLRQTFIGAYIAKPG